MYQAHPEGGGGGLQSLPGRAAQEMTATKENAVLPGTQDPVFQGHEDDSAQGDYLGHEDTWTGATGLRGEQG